MSNYGFSYDRDSYGRNTGGSFVRNPNYGKRRNQGQPKKSSGCKIKIDSDGNCFVNAWKKNRRNGDFFTLSVHYFKRSKFKVRTSKSGKQWVFVIGNICKNGIENIPIAGLLDITGKRCYFKESNTIATTGGAGGYWGKHISKTYNR